MAAKKKTSDDDNLTEQLGIRVTAADRTRLESLAERFPAMKAGALARTAFLFGLDAIEKHPTILLGEKPKAR
jgi:hypothetical protein